uniref:Uncharacterized protein n=1 Tax=viral metagenome TaxID=1070528 RepID=A0A6C0AZG4_9ZZZZ
MKSRRFRKNKNKKRTRKNRTMRGGLATLFNAIRERRSDDAMNILQTIHAERPEEEVKQIINRLNGEGYSALSYAIDNRLYDVIMELLRYGADISDLDSDDPSVVNEVNSLWTTAIDNENIPLLELLLQRDDIVTNAWLDYTLHRYENHPNSENGKIIKGMIGNKLDSLGRLPKASANNSTDMNEFLQTWRTSKPIGLVRHTSAVGVQPLSDTRTEVNLDHEVLHGNEEDLLLPNEFDIPVRHEYDPLDRRYVLPQAGLEPGSGETHYIDRAVPIASQRVRTRPWQIGLEHNPNETFWNGGPNWFDRPTPRVNEEEAIPLVPITPRTVEKVDVAVPLGGKKGRSTRSRLKGKGKRRNTRRK